MTMNKKGVESLPFYFLISIFLVSVFSVLMFSLINSFLSSRDVINFYNDVNEIKNTVEWLKSSSDVNSFSSFAINIPKSHELVFQNSNIVVTNSSDSFSLITFVNFNEKISLSPGEYNLVFYFGDCEDKEFVIEFN